MTLLASAGYEVDVRKDYIAAERLEHEGDFDLVILALHREEQLAATYSDALSRTQPRLPILLLTDWGVFAPPGTLSQSLEAGNPGDLMRRIAAMLVGSMHIRELETP
jgi:CheY-like chemotaxis protein